MADEISELQDKIIILQDKLNQRDETISKLEERIARQRSEMRDLIEELDNLKGTEHETPYISCFIAMPFCNTYNSLLQAVRLVLEDYPYGWNVARADTLNLGLTISSNVERYITRSHCYLAEISDSNPNVFLEIGRMSHYQKKRSLIYLCKEEAKDRIPRDLDGYLVHFYIEHNLEDLVDCLKRQFRRNSNLENLRHQQSKEIFLSAELLTYHKVCEQDIAEKISDKYKTVENFLKFRTTEVAKELNEIPRSSSILEAEYFLKDRFKI
jgi:hypothetical protein